LCKGETSKGQLGRNHLCKECDEDISHLLYDYTFVRLIWKDIETLFDIINCYRVKMWAE